MSPPAQVAPPGSRIQAAADHLGKPGPPPRYPGL